MPELGFEIARLADRRLREAMRDVAVLAEAGTSAGLDDAHVEHACLAIKASVAERAGTEALGRLTSARATRARPLADRIRLHALEADAALERAAAALRSYEARSPSVTAPATGAGSAAPEHRPTDLRLPMVAAAAVVVIAILVGPGLLDRRGDTQPVGEGTLDGISSDVGGGTSGPAASPIATPAATLVPTAQPPVAEPSPNTELAIDFDDVRMGSGIGEGWRNVVGGVDAAAIAAFPTAVDRSAQLVVLGSGVVVETCRSFEPRVSPVQRLSVDVLLSRATATAIMSVGVVPGDPELRVSLSASEITMIEGGSRVLADGEGLDARAWHRVDIVVEERTTLWRVTRLDGSSSPVLESRVETGVPTSVGEVCLAVSGDVGDAAYIDNLTIVTSQGG